jgi:polysaccharide pyruvyl transferase WcaK-like protein
MKIAKKVRFFRQALFQPDPKMIYVLGWHGHNNLGDEAIYGAMRKLFNGINLVDFTKGAESKLVAKKISQINRAVLGGGTTIGYKLSSINNLKYCFDLCSETLVFGAGVTELDGWKENLKQSLNDSLRGERNKTWKMLLEKCMYVGVRGPLSFSALCQRGISNIEIIGDPVISLADNTPSEKISSGRTLGVNLTLQKGMRGDINEISEKIISFIKFAQSKNWNVLWFVVNPRDLLVTETIAKKTQTAQSILKLYRDYKKFMEIVKSCDVFIGTRLHSVILAISSYTPSIMLDYKPKCHDFMASIDQEKLTIRTDKINVSELYELTENILSNRSSLVDELVAKVGQMKKKQINKAKELKSLLLKP